MLVIGLFSLGSVALPLTGCGDAKPDRDGDDDNGDDDDGDGDGDGDEGIGGDLREAAKILLGDPDVAPELRFQPGEESEPPEWSNPELGPTEMFDLGEYQVSLGGAAGSRLLVMNISVESIPDSFPSIESKQPQIRDAILMLASDYTVRELEGLDGKLRLRDDIHRRINAVLAPHKVLRVYYTDFRLQG